MKWMRRIFIVIGILTLIHQYLWYQRTPKLPTDLIAPEKMTVWANAGGSHLTDTTLLAAIESLKEVYGASQIQLNLVYAHGDWYADSARETLLTAVVTQFPFLHYWLTFTQFDTAGLGVVARLIRSQELERQVVFSSASEDILQHLRLLLPDIPQIMPPAELRRFTSFRKFLLLPFYHTGFEVALIPMDTTRGNYQLSRKFIRSLGHLGIPVWVDGVQNLSQLVWLEERDVKSVKMDRVDLALMPRATLLSQPPQTTAPPVTP